jgi:hypothetical protein
MSSFTQFDHEFNNPNAFGRCNTCDEPLEAHFMNSSEYEAYSEEGRPSAEEEQSKRPRWFSRLQAKEYTGW